MKREPSLGRRRFLVLAGFALAALGFGKLRAAAATPPATDAAQALARRIAALPGRRASARAVGRAYLERQPEEAHVERLVASLIGDATSHEARCLIDDPDALRRAVRARCRRDFADGELVAIGGWLLARSEARICALAHLA